MNRLDLIIDALEESLKDFATDCYGYYYRSCCGADLERGEHGDDCHLLKALAAARELRALKPVGYMDTRGVLFNNTTHPHLNIALYALDEVNHD